jgi:hypothetical protein
MPLEYLDLFRPLILYQRFDEPIRPGDGKFKHNGNFEPWDEAYLAVDMTHYLVFNAKDRSLKVVKTEMPSGYWGLSHPSPQMTIDVAKLDHPVATGYVFWRRYDKYLLLDLRVKDDLVKYIFKLDSGQWKPLRGTDGSRW